MRAVLILGMHRSGTSALAGCFREAGLYMGQVLDKAAKRNPRGHQEPSSLIFMHENLLAENGGSWHQPPDPIVWGRLHTAVRDLFIESRQDKGVWGFKEPRTLLVAEGWIEALDDWRGVGVFRDPRSVVASLNERNGFDVEYAMGVWEAYNRRLLDLHQRFQIPLVEYCADEAYVRRAFADAIAGAGLSPPDSLEFLELGLMNQRPDMLDITMSSSAESLFRTLQARARSPGAEG